jgi:hypothetical protein
MLMAAVQVNPGCVVLFATPFYDDLFIVKYLENLANVIGKCCGLVAYGLKPFGTECEPHGRCASSSFGRIDLTSSCRFLSSLP